MSVGPQRAVRTSAAVSDLERLAWPVLPPEVVAVLREAGEVRDLADGDVLFDVGEDHYDFALLERGAVDIVDRAGERVVVRIEAPNFVGELGMLFGRGTFFAGVAAGPTRALVVPQERIRELVATVPEVSDLLVTAFSARRRLLIEWGEGGLAIVGDEGDPATTRLLEFASRSRLPHRFVDRRDATALAAVPGADLIGAFPAVVTGRSTVVERPEPRDLARALRLDLAAEGDGGVVDLVVVGAGPAGLAASVYGASEGLATLTVEDTAIGGQAGTSSRIENYLGFSTGISGDELAFQAEVQAIKFGARLSVPRRAVGLERAPGGFEVALDEGTRIRARAVVLANGVRYRRLPIEGLEPLEGAGVYYAATELEARFCSGRDVVIVGGANSAGQAAMFLSRHASLTHVVVRGEGLSETMSSYLSSRITSDPRIRLWTGTEVVAAHGEGGLDEVTLRERSSGAEQRIPAGGLFVMVGAAPNTEWLRGVVDLDDKGFVVTGHDGRAPFESSLPGVFAVGDIRAGSVKRVASAVGEGSVVVSSVHRRVAELVSAEEAAAGGA